LSQEHVEALVAERVAARQAKDFARSDALRDELLALGVALMDGPQGTSWKIA
jgi:cysteinyl-tRNA synthetase